MSERRIFEKMSEKDSPVVEPKFWEDSELSLEQRTDPDYRLKELQRLSRQELTLTCSRCHHCRR